MTILKKAFPLLMNAIALMAAYVIANPLKFGICRNIYHTSNYSGCLDGSIIAIGDPAIGFLLPILVVTSALIFVGGRVYSTWLKFAWWGLIVSIILIAIIAPDSHNWWPGPIFTRTTMAWVMGILFACISLIIIAWRSWKLRGK